MQLIPSIHPIVTSALLATLATLAATVHGGPPGINRDGTGSCLWRCGNPNVISCTQAFADGIGSPTDDAVLQNANQVACQPNPNDTAEQRDDGGPKHEAGCPGPRQPWLRTVRLGAY